VESAGAASAVDAGDGGFAKADAGLVRGAGDAEVAVSPGAEDGAEEDGQIGVVADNEDVFVIVEASNQFFKGREIPARAESFGNEDSGVVSGLGTDERGGLKSALERAGDDEIELDV